MNVLNESNKMKEGGQYTRKTDRSLESLVFVRCPRECSGAPLGGNRRASWERWPLLGFASGPPSTVGAGYNWPSTLLCSNDALT